MIPPGSNAGNLLLAAAMRLRSMGISVLPIGKDKKPAIRSWAAFQHQIAEEAQIREWFRKSSVTGLGIILGPVSGELVVRDFDTAEAYEAWKRLHPDLAALLPTARTNRGFHVYGRIQNGKTQNFGDGELRGAGCYVVAPPSRHPEGTHYCWQRGLISLDDIPLLTVEESGFGERWDGGSLTGGNAVRATERTETPETTDENRGRLRATERTETPEITDENRGRLRTTEEHRSHSQWGKQVSKLQFGMTTWLSEAILITIPSSPGNRNKALFQFARRLMSRPEYADADPTQLEGILREWHRIALPNLGTKDFDETRIDFFKGWDRIKYPHGTGPFADAMKRLNEAELPRCADRYDDVNKRRLVGLCRELQRINLAGPFFLSCRTAGECVNVDHTTANRWLFLLCADGILELVDPGDKKRAARYRYLPEV